MIFSSHSEIIGSTKNAGFIGIGKKSFLFLNKLFEHQIDNRHWLGPLWKSVEEN